jgi:tryptophanyl-tRNA synthetase
MAEEAKKTVGKTKARAFSGIQPSGELHIGNYLGAIKNWVAMLDKYECVFCVVDYHAITIPYDAGEMLTRTRDAVAANMAAGLDPERCILFVQSHVPEHTELAWVLGTCCSVGDLERMTQFKEKSEQHREFVNAGLFTYPVLQAADILLYKASLVPVGDDQIQHIELSRRIARRFNSRFGETFPEPNHVVGKAARVMGLDAKAKMSKSRDNYIALVEPPESIWEKLRPAATDPARVRRKDPGTPEKCNIHTMHEGFSPAEDLEWVRTGCRTAGIGCIECKKKLCENMSEELAPVRERYAEVTSRPDYVEEVIEAGAARARAIAEPVMAEVRGKLGIRG